MNASDRILLVVLALAYIPGTPGLGVDTRTDAPAVLGIVYGVAFFAPLVALAASWKRPRAAAWLVVVSGVFAVVLPALDLAGVLASPPPTGMVVLNVVILALGLAVIWRGWLRTRDLTT
jgi:hypothetical protein